MMTKINSSLTDNVMEPKKRQISYLYLLLFLSSLLTFPALYLICFYTPPLRISEETTRITGPLTPDGQIDFLRHLEEAEYPPEWATDDNGYRIFVRTFGCSDKDNSYKEQVYKKFGLDINIPPIMTFPEEPRKIITEYYAKRGEAIPLQKLDKAWTLEDLPMLSDWVATVDAPLDVAAEMFRKPVFFLPCVLDEQSYRTGKSRNLFTHSETNFQMIRSLAQQYKARATYRLTSGNIDGTIDDIITIYQLGRKFEQHSLKFSQLLFGFTTEGMAHGVPLVADWDHLPTKEQLQRLWEMIDQQPPRPSFEKTFERKRVFVLSDVQALMNNDIVLNIEVPSYLLLCDRNIVYRRINEAFDTQTGKRPRSELDSYMRLPSTIDEYGLQMLTPRGRGKSLSAVLTNYLVTSPEGMEDAVRRSDCAYNMKRLVLALLIYKAEHGELPQSDWIEKIKPYLGEHFAQYLCCPSCSVQEEGKTNYALILYDKLPKDLNTFLLVELREPVPFEQAVVSVDNVVTDFIQKNPNGSMKAGQVGSAYRDGMNTAKQNGSVGFTSGYNINELRQQLGL
jgi:hypothetical protein